MIGYTTLGTNNLERARRFYNALFAGSPVNEIYTSEKFVAWGTDTHSPMFCITYPYDGETATVGNGVMIGLLAKTTKEVDALYNKALELGGQDEGAPGERSGNYYCAYVRDLDGNKLNFFLPPDK